MANIVESLSDKRLQIGSEEFVRKLGMRTNWGKVRIGMRMGMNGSSNVLSAYFQIGLCEGTVDTFKSPNTVGYLGVSFGNLYPDTYTYTAGYFYSGGGMMSVVRTGGSTTATYVNTSLVSQYWMQAPNRSTLLLDIAKVGPTSYNVKLWTPVNAPDRVDTSLGTYYTQLESESAPPGLTNPVGVGGTTLTQTGSLDTVSILWSHSTPTVELSDVNVLRFY